MAAHHHKRGTAARPARAQPPVAVAVGAEKLQIRERWREEIAATGARTRTRLTTVDALTASELRVAHLAVRGHTNREIAQTLFVTRKTVETHLAAIYRKLGVRSRAELAIRLARAAEPLAGDQGFA